MQGGGRRRRKPRGKTSQQQKPNGRRRGGGRSQRRGRCWPHQADQEQHAHDDEGTQHQEDHFGLRVGIVPAHVRGRVSKVAPEESRAYGQLRSADWERRGRRPAARARQAAQRVAAKTGRGEAAGEAGEPACVRAGGRMRTWPPCHPASRRPPPGRRRSRLAPARPAARQCCTRRPRQG